MLLHTVSMCVCMFPRLPLWARQSMCVFLCIFPQWIFPIQSFDFSQFNLACLSFWNWIASTHTQVSVSTSFVIGMCFHMIMWIMLMAMMMMMTRTVITQHKFEKNEEELNGGWMIVPLMPFGGFRREREWMMKSFFLSSSLPFNPIKWGSSSSLMMMMVMMMIPCVCVSLCALEWLLSLLPLWLLVKALCFKSLSVWVSVMYC